MNTDKLWTVISSIERQLNNLKGELIDIDEEITQSDDAYQKGLDDAWEAARKIVLDEGIDMNALCTIFRRGCSDSIIRDYSASEAIEKLEAYEEKQKAEDEIKVGDEVISKFTKTKGILLEPETQHLLARVIVPNDRWSTFDIRHANLTKTGRHFNIEKLLEEMKK